MTKELAKTLTLALVNYIDENRPEESMCCSNAECKSIEEMFEGDQLDIIEAFIKKKLTRLTEFEEKLYAFALQCGGQWDTATEEAKKWSNEFLSLARRELLSYADERNPAIEAMADLERTYFTNPDKLPKWLKDDIARKELNAHTKGYNKGYEVATKLYEESVAYHFPNPPAINIPTWTPPCYYGGPCTNPFHDCINCPRTIVVMSSNTASGTSTATLHGNASATDGKEHNPSFID